LEQADPGFVRFTHRRCEDCEIREDLHASGAAIPQRRHRIAKCQTCAGKGELRLDHKTGLDPYRTQPAQGRPQAYAAKRQLRAHSERHRFRPKSFSFEECELVMQIPPGGFNHGRARNEDGTWRTLESEGRDGDIRWNPSFKGQVVPIKHGTRSAYTNGGCRCFMSRRANALYKQRKANGGIAISRGQIIPLAVEAKGAFPVDAHGPAAA